MTRTEINLKTGERDERSESPLAGGLPNTPDLRGSTRFLSHLIENEGLDLASAKYLNKIIRNAFESDGKTLSLSLFEEIARGILSISEWKTTRGLPEALIRYKELYRPLVIVLGEKLFEYCESNREGFDSIVSLAKTFCDSPLGLAQFIKSLPKEYLSNTPAEIVALIRRFKGASAALIKRNNFSNNNILEHHGEFLDTLANLTQFHPSTFNVAPQLLTHDREGLLRIATTLREKSGHVLQVLAFSTSERVDDLLQDLVTKFGRSAGKIYRVLLRESTRHDDRTFLKKFLSTFTPFWELAKTEGLIDDLENSLEVFRHPQLFTPHLNPTLLSLFRDHPSDFGPVVLAAYAENFRSPDLDVSILIERAADALKRVSLALPYHLDNDPATNLIKLVSHEYTLFRELTLILGNHSHELLSALTPDRWRESPVAFVLLAKRYGGALIGALQREPSLSLEKIAAQDELLLLAKELSPLHCNKAVAHIPPELLKEYLRHYGDDAYIAFSNDKHVPSPLHLVGEEALSLPGLSRIPHLYRFHRRDSFSELLEESQRNLDPTYKPDRRIYLFTFPWSDWNGAFSTREKQLLAISEHTRLLLADCSSIDEVMVHVIRAATLFGVNEHGRPNKPVYCLSLAGHANSEIINLGGPQVTLYSREQPAEKFYNPANIERDNIAFFRELSPWLERGGIVSFSGCCTAKRKDGEDALLDAAARELTHQHLYGTLGLSFGMSFAVDPSGTVRSVAANGCGTRHIPPRRQRVRRT